MDVLDEILSSLRLTGGVVIDAEFTGDYCVRAQFTPHHCAPWFATPQTMISYHYVRSGTTVALVDGMPPVTLEPGSIVILPRNEPHLLASRIGLPPADVGEISWITAEGVHRVSSGSPGDKTEVWCGFLGTADSGDHPLIDALPPLLTLNVAGQEAQWVESSLRFLSESNPSPEIIARQAELFLAQAIREYVSQLAPSSKGWLRGLTDPAVSKALSIIHNRYAEDFNVETLAREAGVSRSVLGERFGELLGESPMRYCARWRMRMACNMLREGKQNTATVAYAVGFGSEAAFNRAFKREFGVPPAAWRKRVEDDQRANTPAEHEMSAGNQSKRDPRPNELFVSGTPTGIHWITRHIREFGADNPELSVQLDPNPQVVNFDDDRADCAIRSGTEPPLDLVAEELFKVDFTPMCSPQFLARHPTLKNPADLRDLQRINPNDPWWHAWWQEFGLGTPMTPARGVDMGAQVLDGLAAIDGQGVALLTPLFWRDELTDGRLVCPFPQAIGGCGTYWLTYPKERREWPKIRRFSAWLHRLAGASRVEARPAEPLIQEIQI